MFNKATESCLYEFPSFSSIFWKALVHFRLTEAISSCLMLLQSLIAVLFEGCAPFSKHLGGHLLISDPMLPGLSVCAHFCHFCNASVFPCLICPFPWPTGPFGVNLLFLGLSMPTCCWLLVSGLILIVPSCYVFQALSAILSSLRSYFACLAFLMTTCRSHCYSSSSCSSYSLSGTVWHFLALSAFWCISVGGWPFYFFCIC